MRKATGSYPYKTAAWVPEFAVEDLPLVRTAALVPEFAVKDLPLGRILIYIYITLMSVKLNIVKVQNGRRSISANRDIW